MSKAGLRGGLAWWLAVAVGFLAAATPATVRSEQRVALVIGQAKYRYVSTLSNTINDARLIGKTLQGLGFVLVGGGVQLDLDEQDFKKAVRNFGAALGKADIGLFYYAGHGFQMQGMNYLVPVDANPTKPSDADFMLIDTALVLRQMDDSAAKLKLLILDACRNYPFAGRGLRDIGSGLAQLQAPVGTLIAYATQPGAVAADGPPGGDSPYSTALALEMQKPGIGFRDMFNNVGVAVLTATHQAQLPWYSSSPIQGNFYFAGLPPAPPAVPPSVSPERARYESRFPIGGHIALAQPTGAPSDKFLGEWYGTFPPSRGHSVETLFAIERIDNDKVTAIYSYGAGGYGAGLPASNRRLGRIAGDRLLFDEAGYALLDIGLRGDGTLEMKWTSSNGQSHSTASLRRIAQ